MIKRAPADYPILDVIALRWSPRAFAPEPLAPDELRSLLEAARWAASCFNEQPWTFLVARRTEPEEFERALSCLSEKNRRWAGNAGALLFAVGRREFARNGKTNRHAWHDVGQADAHLALQATALGLAAHQMAGFSPDAVRELFGVPDGWDPVTAIAVGRPGRAEDLDEDFRASETGPRSRKGQDELVFEGRWGRAPSF